jgi:H(+)-translocating pyrophosphatase
MPWGENSTVFPYTTVAFIIGALTSMLCGYIGMIIATTTNVKTTYLCNIDIEDGFIVAFQGGEVLGFVLVGLALLVLEILVLTYNAALKPNDLAGCEHLFECISGYGLGGSTVALFGRVGGGIYTKAADVGADLAGKVENALPEDSPLNPGTIADNVGDNVGDIAGMGADLFGSLAEATCAALVVSSTSTTMLTKPDAIFFPLVVTATGIFASFLCQFLAYIKGGNVEFKLKVQLWASTILLSLMLIPTIYMLPDTLDLEFAGKAYATTPWEAYGCIMLGLWSGLFIGLVTEYYTSNENAPVQGLARACEFGAAPNIIDGLALGYMSTVIPIFCLAVTVLFAFQWAAMYGVALAAIGMLGALPIALTIDGYGPISDNAGGIAEMSNLEESVRHNTDTLDAAGNTTAAIGKGFAIGSACLVALALFGAFVTRVSVTVKNMEDAQYTVEEIFNVNILEPFTFAGLLIGAMLPYWFSAMTMKAVGDAAQDMIKEIKRQMGPIMRREEGYPDHEACINISTEASLQKMIAPGALVIISPLLAGALFGYKAVTGILAGAIVSGIQIAFSASNSGGAWDNAKKYVESGSKWRRDPPVEGMSEFINKKEDREIHAGAVVGDTVGDPLKDTSGPAINILIKLSAICSLVFGTFIAEYGGQIDGSLHLPKE